MKILVTGGSGFIGSNLVESFLNNDKVSFVRVLDNLATGHLSNIQEFMDNSIFEFSEGDIRDKEICVEACKGIDSKPSSSLRFRSKKY
jgi:UDP-N-acetylglucosamine 4-epimerase